ncbi:hypothetical protein FY557_13840 [Chryseobacterium sp. SN22]|uniref:hypothetical protein n=1 Tax=Chryseobacterium sp. SN22 TaxID=2606431 RepID=UPI0011EC6FE9|nr:hypothetical protein [Chryseobacterium sp. SN22]KAA0127248.1 hypothetical protein FY557_13840 [Chryseobacterium sp. SN22]
MRNHMKLFLTLSLLLPGLLLSLKSQVCTVDVNGQTFAMGDGSSIPAGTPHTFTQPATNYGFTLDIYSLDNSFNMNINGTLLATQEIEFATGAGLTQNIQFADGAKWQDGNVPAVWSISGSASTTPAVRVVISPTGGITMFGSKSSGGPLLPLVLTNGNAFNTISWNTTGNNSVTVTQNVVGPTRISGYGSGKNTVPCHCTQPGAAGTPAGFTKMGILTKGSKTVTNWPESVPNGHIVLDASDKGMVISHMTTAQRNALVPVEGMLIYNTDLKCVQLYRGSAPAIDAARTGWNCISRGCNENR